MALGILNIAKDKDWIATVAVLLRNDVSGIIPTSIINNTPG
ncbi:MAG: hypothetical protein ACJARD_001602 [Alphaproteobacteria bacterium]|jgi:hypothetical protein